MNDEAAPRIHRVDITPDTSILPKLGKSGYSVIQALSELVDNSIDARVVGSQLLIRITMNKEAIVIEDNGSGMDAEGLTAAMKLGHTQKTGNGTLGAYGLGMKTACTSLGRTFEIWTTPLGGAETYYMRFDEDEWERKGSWTNFTIEAHPVDPDLPQGTRIKITKLRVWYPNLVVNAKPEFGERYYPFIQDDDVEILVNGKACTAIPPKTGPRHEFEVTFKTPDEKTHTVSGWWAEAVEGSTQDHGFHLYRGGRLIEQFAAVGFSKHPELGKLIGELRLNPLPVSHNKREFLKETEEWKAFEEEFTKFIKPITSELRNESKKGAEEGPRQVRKKVNARLSAIAPILGGSTLLQSLAEKPLNESGSGLELGVKFQKMGASGPERRLEQEGSRIDVVSNSDLPLLEEVRDKELLTMWYAAEALAESMVPSMNHRRIVAIRDFLLRAAYAKGLHREKDPEKVKERMAGLEKSLEAHLAQIGSESK